MDRTVIHNAKIKLRFNKEMYNKEWTISLRK